MKSSFSCTVVQNLGVHCCGRLLVAGIVVFRHGAWKSGSWWRGQNYSYVTFREGIVVGKVRWLTGFPDWPGFWWLFKGWLLFFFDNGVWLWGKTDLQGKLILSKFKTARARSSFPTVQDLKEVRVVVFGSELSLKLSCGIFTIHKGRCARNEVILTRISE